MLQISEGLKLLIKNFGYLEVQKETMANNNGTVLDALIVGAGFSGIHTLCKLRKLGFSAQIYESGGDLGGTWFWNRYPGARVDSETPIYQLSEEKEVWSTFEFNERFPGRQELQRYFHYADDKLRLSKDIHYNTCVTEASFDDERNQWLIKAENGLTTWAKHLILCTGFASKRYTPPFEGLETFQGDVYHAGVWPEEGVDLAEKRVAIIGTGASGVQIIQEIGPVVSHLTVYQRTPNLAIPMQQCFRDKENTSSPWKFPPKEDYERIFKNLHGTYGSLVIDMDFTKQKYEESTPEERQALYEYLWNYGGFSYWLATYKEIFFVQEANDEVYNFWCEKVRARLNDPAKQDILAPKVPPHAWGTKRPCLEQAFYEVFNQNNVDIINIRKSPILEITPEGVKTEKEGVVPVDVLILATGFDSVTGGILNIKIVNGQGLSIQEKWGNGTCTYLGMTTAGFPNLYWFYGPQAPTAFSNGPTCGGLQSDWVVELMVKMRQENKSRIDAHPDAEAAWVKNLTDLWNNSLFPPTDSWYQGANIPGKIREPLNYFGGIPAYIKALKECAANNYEGFELV